jgi:hypothetical protein
MSRSLLPADARGRAPHRRSLLLGVTLAVAALMTLAVPAAIARHDAEEHCVFLVTDQAPDGELTLAPLGCSPTFAEAMAVASGGALSLSLDTPGGAVFSDTAVAEAVSSFTLGIHFDGYNGTGSSITVVGTSCSGGWWNAPAWFNNLTSSSYNGCYRLAHYDYANLGGASAHTVGAGATHNLTTFNNRTGSVQYLDS